MALLEYMMEVNISYYSVLKNMMPLTRELHILWVKNVVSHIFFFRISEKNEIDSDDDLPQEKPMTLNNVVIHMKSILNKDPNRY